MQYGEERAGGTESMYIDGIAKTEREHESTITGLTGQEAPLLGSNIMFAIIQSD